MNIIRFKNFFLLLSAGIVALAFGALLVFGLRPGIDFTGGTLAEVSYTEYTERTVLENALTSFDLGGYSLRSSDETGYVLRTRPLEAHERGAVLRAIEDTGASITRLTEVGPTIGTELRRKSVVALGLIVLMIALYIAFAFRSVSKPVSSWVYGFITILILAHDVLIPAGVFAFLGYLFGAEVDVLFVTALLVVLGYSVNDTIVVFDRIRERLHINTQMNRKEDFEKTVGTALSETYARSINTSLTTLVTLIALYWFGGSATEYFALMLIAGVIAGTYSSLFIASPLLVIINNWRNNTK